MADFTHVLRRAENSLHAPEPHRSRILLEISADLEALYSELLARGLSSTEAAARAEAMFGASSSVLDELDEVHLSASARFLARFTRGSRHRAERALLTAVTLCAVTAGAGGVLATGLATPVSPLLWPLPLVLAAAVWLAAAALLELYGPPTRLLTRERLQPLVAIAGLSAALGALGMLVLGWQIAGAVERAPAELSVALPHLRRGAELLALYLCVSLMILLGWFHLRIRALEVECASVRARRLTHPYREGDRS